MSKPEGEGMDLLASGVKSLYPREALTVETGAVVEVLFCFLMIDFKHWLILNTRGDFLQKTALRAKAGTDMEPREEILS